MPGKPCGCGLCPLAIASRDRPAIGCFHVRGVVLERVALGNVGSYCKIAPATQLGVSLLLKELRSISHASTPIYLPHRVDSSRDPRSSRFSLYIFLFLLIS